MFERTRAGWRLASATRRIIFKDKRLLLYPLVSGLLVVLEFAAIFGVGVLLDIAIYGVNFIGVASAATLLVGSVLLYVASAFSTTYVSLAMLVAFRSHLSSTPIGIGRAFSEAKGYANVVIQWALFFSVIILVLRAIGGLFSGPGQIVVRLVFSAIGSIAISLATMFALPVILDHKTGPIQTVKESIGIVTRNFGATFGGLIFSDLYSTGIAAIGLAVFLGSVVVGIATVTLWVLVVGLIVSVGVFVFAFALSSVLGTAFKFILYEYLNGKGLPEGFDAGMITSSIKTKGGTTPSFGSMTLGSSR